MPVIRVRRNLETKMSQVGEPTDGWERSRKENLLYFASLTPDQRLIWLWEMMEFVANLRKGGSAQAAGAQPEP